MSDEVVSQTLAGNRRAVARLITRVERGDAAAEAAIAALFPHTGRAHIIGITGSPGAGKSTLVNAVARHFRQDGRTVGIIAVDPTSPFTGGALLGDRVRMTDLYGDKGIFIRSMASRGQLGGLARATGDVARVLDAAGYDIVLIETVGAGQAEVDVAATAHTTIVIEAPGMGDDIQSIKAGILEIADVLVVNKADRPGAANTVRALRTMLQLGQRMRVNHHGTTVEVAPVVPTEVRAWEPPIIETVATTGQGVAQLVETLDRHRVLLQAGDGWAQRERQRTQRELEQLLLGRLWQRWQSQIAAAEREALITAVATRRLDPYSAVNQLIAALTA